MSSKVLSQNCCVCIGIVTADNYNRSDSVLLAYLGGNLELLLGFQLGSAGADDIETAGITVLIDVCIIKNNLIVFDQTTGTALETVKNVFLIRSL